MDKYAKIRWIGLVAAVLLVVLALAVSPAGATLGNELDPEHNNLDSREGEIQQPAGLATDQSECTIGVNDSSKTTHDSPVLWKMRDWSETLFKENPGLCQSVQYYSDPDMPYDFIAVVFWMDDWPDGMEDPKAIGMGLNEAGVGTGNAVVDSNIPHLSNYEFLYLILGNFSAIEDVEDIEGIRSYIAELRNNSLPDNFPSGNFPFIDIAGNASMFELDPSEVDFWEYDTLDPDRESQGLLGFVVRANEFHKQDDGTDDTSIKWRYLTGTENTLGLINAGELNEQTVIQSDSNEEYRLIRNSEQPWPISHRNSRSAMAIRGAAPGEDPALATMWALLGNPSFSIAVPTWASVSDIPDPISTCAMYEAVTSLYDAKQIKEEFVQAVVLSAESHLFDMVNNRILPHWREIGGQPAVDEMTRIEHQMALDAYSVIDYLATAGTSNLAPTVDFEANQRVGLEYEFIADAADADGDIASYLWDFGDGTTSIEVSPEHNFLGAGVYLVSVTVADDDGVTTTAWRYLTLP